MASNFIARDDIQDVGIELKADIQAFHDQYVIEMAQVHEELGRIHEMLLYIIQRLPAQPIQPPPAQFSSHEK